MSENLDRRVLGAIRLLDRATGQPVSRPLELRGEGFRFVRNRSHLQVILAAPGLSAHTSSFSEIPEEPPAQSFTLTVSDPRGQYLPRRFQVVLPRDPNPANADQHGSLFRPVDVTLYPAATAELGTNWSTVRVSVTRDLPGEGTVGARGALVRVLAEGSAELLASGIADERGEALAVVPGVRAFESAPDGGDGGDSPVVISEIDARVEVSFTVGRDWPVDAQALEDAHAGALQATLPISLRTGREEKAALTLA